MLTIPQTVRIFLHTAAVDLRKSFDGLSGLVSQAFPREDLLAGHLFLFLNKRRDRIKILHWDADGLVIWYKKHEPDCARFRPFTGNRGHTHNLAGRPVSAGGMGSNPATSRARRRPMSRDTAGLAPPRARRSPSHRRTATFGAG
jgi:hypothetical protein